MDISSEIVFDSQPHLWYAPQIAYERWDMLRISILSLLLSVVFASLEGGRILSSLIHFLYGLLSTCS